MDLTGQFPVTSKGGYQYRIVMYCEASNYIHIELLRTRSGQDSPTHFAGAPTSGARTVLRRSMFD